GRIGHNVGTITSLDANWTDQMLNDTLFRIPRADGLQPLQMRGDHGAAELSSWRVRLSPGGSLTHTIPGEEAVLVLQNGSGSFAADGTTWQVHRPSVFKLRATALYLPPGVAVTITAETDLEAIL